MPKEKQLLSLQKANEYMVCISAGQHHTLGLQADSTVIATGYNTKTHYYYDRVKRVQTVSFQRGLLSTKTRVNVGTAYKTGDLKSKQLRSGQCDTGDWVNIIAVSAGATHSIGLRADGTVAAKGDNDKGQCKVKGWRDITAISAGHWHTVGLKADGTVIAAGGNDIGQCNTGDWSDIAAISAGSWHTAGLRKDGTVVVVGRNFEEQCNTKEWTDIVAVSVRLNIVGLKSNGTVVAVGATEQCKTGDWRDIVAVAAGFLHTIGLKADGTVVAIGSNKKGQCNIGEWQDIGVPSAEIIEQSLSWEKQGLCAFCGGQLGGLFTKKCKVCGKQK